MPYIGTSPTQGVRVRYIYTATASQTAFSGADANGVTLRYQDEEYVDVYKNGLILKTGTDYSLSNNTTMTLASGASNGDKIAIIVYDVFNVTVDDAYTKSTADGRFLNVAGDTMSGALDLNGVELVLDADGDTSITADTDDQIDIKIGNTDVVNFKNSSNDFVITQAVQDKDIIFKGDDNGSAITALTLDMSEAGAATFNAGATFGGAVLPAADDTHDLGSSSKQWRDIYTGDINLNNTKTRDNEVDGTRGSWTIQEGKDDLYILNRLNGKKYRFKLEEMK